MKIAESGNFAFKEKYLVKKVDVDNIGTNTLIPIDIYVEDGDSKGTVEIFHKKTILEKNKSIFQFLDNLIDIFAASKSIPLEIVINKTPDGINVGFMTARYKSTHVHIPITENAEVKNNNESEIVEAKELFIPNLNHFAKPIRATWAVGLRLSDEEICKLWIESINTVNNSSKLLSLFKSCNNDISIWKNIVESWGMKMDKCKKYPYPLLNRTFYDIVSEEVSSAQYEVVEPCVTIWTTDGDKKKEICVLKGKVRICQG